MPRPMQEGKRWLTPEPYKRSNVESTFSAVKRKFGDSVRSKADTAMVNEVLCKFLCHNLCCLIQEQCELGIEPIFWGEQSAVSEPRDTRQAVGLLTTKKFAV